MLNVKWIKWTAAALLWLGAASQAADLNPSPKTDAAGPPAIVKDHFVRDGVVIDFEAKPLEGTELMEDKLAEIRFRFTDERSGAPLKGISPAAWMDIAANIQGQAGSQQRECKEKIGLYLRGTVGIRPLVDMNGYYLLVMNRDASITVVEPMVSMAGRTSTYQVILLRRPPMDWADQSERKRLFVSMPEADEVAVVDTESFKVIDNLPAGKEPVRLALQPDGKYLWIGNNGKSEKDSGVTIVDTANLRVVTMVPTGAGHHEIAFSPDSRHAFVSNRDAGTVSIFDTGTLAKVKDVKTGAVPLSVAYSSLSDSAYVSDGQDGSITVIDGKSLSVTKTISAKKGLGPLRFSRNGRFGIAVNTPESVVYVIDAARNEIIHVPKVQKSPYQVIFSDAFAYVRGLDSERVTMIDLSSLGKGTEPIVQSFPAGAATPRAGGDLPLADSMAVGLGETAAFIVNPGENTTYFYMEGMNSPMNNYRAQGHIARAVRVIDRSLREIEPGVYVGRFRIPVPGKYDVAMQLEQPRMLHCFAAHAKVNPEKEKLRHSTNVDLLTVQREFTVGEPAKIRFRLIGGDGNPRNGIRGAMVRYFRAPNSTPREVAAPEVEPGIFEAALDLPTAGPYYVYVGVPTLKIGFGEMGFLTLMAKNGQTSGAKQPVVAPPAPAEKKSGGKG